MIVRVQRCWAGNRNYWWELRLPSGKRLMLRNDEGEPWSRAYSTSALNLIESETRVDRSKIRFRHV